MEAANKCAKSAEWVARSSTTLCSIFAPEFATSGYAQVIFKEASAPATGTLATGTNTVTLTPGVRKTFNPLGDPAMRIKAPNSNASH